MKLFSNSSSLNSRAYYFYQKIQIQFFSTTPTRTRSSKKRSSSLYSKISQVGDPNLSMVPVLDQWIGEGNDTFRGELRRVINELMVSLWMTNKRGHPVAPFDVAVRLKLIFRIFGLDQLENYFNKIPENLRTYHVYLALLNCYTMAKSVDKAESIMQKARDLGYVSKAIWYNLMMNLHYQLGNKEKLSDLLIEMEAKGISYDQFTLSVCLRACAMASDEVGMDKIVRIMESDPLVNVHWQTCVIAADGYLKMGLIDKALVILKKLEGKLTTSNKSNILFVFLFKLYAEAGIKDELYRVWNLYKQNGNVVNRVYISMMRALMTFGDIEGTEKIFEEWESSGLSVDFRIPNFLIDAYCTDGRLEKAEELIAKGISKGGDPVAITWCHLAGGYLKKNRVPEAVEALKKAISRCPTKFKTKDSLITCLEYLEKGDKEKAEELIKFVRARGISREVASDDTCSLIKDVEFQSCDENLSSEGMFASEDEHINDKGNIDRPNVGA
ncbi:hypothetical protein DH2020_041910 [Rehmannia glutinosa]|uniref:Pentatricopeptide repeat-containing protein n=1 Tax=Rehmannia glutinosa TaxID=99300 RepID=A0ABR0UNR7_REHGL